MLSVAKLISSNLHDVTMMCETNINMSIIHSAAPQISD
jgi:hypothetical protein